MFNFSKKHLKKLLKAVLYSLEFSTKTFNAWLFSVSLNFQLRIGLSIFFSNASRHTIGAQSLGPVGLRNGIYAGHKLNISMFGNNPEI